MFWTLLSWRLIVALRQFNKATPYVVDGHKASLFWDALECPRMHIIVYIYIYIYLLICIITQVIMSLYDLVSKMLNPMITHGLMRVNHYHCPPRLYLLEGSVLNLSCPCFFRVEAESNVFISFHMEVSWNRGIPSYHPFEIGLFHYRPSILGYLHCGNPLYVHSIYIYIYLFILWYTHPWKWLQAEVSFWWAATVDIQKWGALLGQRVNQLGQYFSTKKSPNQLAVFLQGNGLDLKLYYIYI